MPRRDAELGAFDIRKASAGYAQTLGSVCGFIVPAVIVIFTAGHPQVEHHPAQFTLIVALLVLSLLGCLGSAFVFSAIAGEEELTPNLPAATMYVGVATVPSVIATLEAFAVLAHVYLQDSTTFFTTIAASGGVVGAVFSGMTVIDDYEMRLNRPWLGKSNWLTSRDDAHRWAVVLAVIAAAQVAAGFALYLAGAHIKLTVGAAEAVAGVGIAVVSLAVIGATVRTVHANEGPDRGISRGEAITLQTLLGFLLLLTFLVLPK